MTSVYGRKVREPKVTARGTLPISKADSQAKGTVSTTHLLDS